jgi:hypothetical protein
MRNIEDYADVLIVGGGTAGPIAAIQAARVGARTLLVEQMGQLGGTMTAGGVCAPAYFWSSKGQVIGGIGWELVSKAVKLDGGVFPDFLNPPPHRESYHVRINPHLYAALVEEACLQAGVCLHYHELPSAALWDEVAKRWVVTFVGKNQRRVVRARELIDCTGGADLVGMLGFARVRGETDGRDLRQPGTLMFSLVGYDAASLDEHAVQRRYDQALAEGVLQPGDFLHTTRPFLSFLRNRGFNCQHIFCADDSTSEGQTDANLRGRASLLRLIRFIQTLPGCEGVRLQSACADAAIRETYRIVGETTITCEDYLGARVFSDAIGYTLYYIDVHSESDAQRPQQHGRRPQGGVPTLPLSALIPKGSRHLLVAGRSISSDRLAYSALRVQASCMAMGQGVGAAAALAVQGDLASRDVPMARLRALLEKHGAILP